MRRKRPYDSCQRRWVPGRLRAEIMLRQDGRCADCGTRLILGFFVFDHRPPLALREAGDDANDPDRLAAICWHCDQSPSRVTLEPAPVQLLCRAAELDEKIAGEILRLDLTALLLPQPDECTLVRTHDGPCIRAAEIGFPIGLPRGVGTAGVRQLRYFCAIG